MQGQTATGQWVSDGTNSATYSYLASSALVDQIEFKHGTTTRMTTTKQWDYLNRLKSVSSVSSVQSVANFSYSYNSANQRTRNTQVDGSYWLYEYDSLGQVISGKKHWSDNTAVAGQQFGYAFDDIGNRKTSAHDSRQSSYNANALNQYTSRTVPGYVPVLGTANSNATVSLWADTGAYAQTSRKGDYFWGELSVNNTAGPAWVTVTNLAVLNNGTTADIVTNIIGKALVAKSPEAFTYDADGNLTSDSLWTNTWNAENRRVVIESRDSVPAAARLREEWAYLPDGRWIERIVSTNDGSAYAPAYTNRYVWDGNVLLAVLNHTNGLELAFMRGLDLSGTLQGAGGVGGLLAVRVGPAGPSGLANTVHFAVNDGNGNVTALVSAATGGVTARYEYGPFAEPIRQTGPMANINPIRFSTQYHDDVTGDWKFLYRDLDWRTGRWLSYDPIEEKGGLDLYCFALNNPATLVDSDGRLVIPFPPLQITEKVAELIQNATRCYNTMMIAKKETEEAWNSVCADYSCCVKGAGIVHLSQFPGVLSGRRAEQWGVKHCMLGYFANKEGASSSCLAAANLAWEGKEFWVNREWGLSVNGPVGWFFDTLEDMTQVFTGAQVDSLESCIPHECTKTSPK